MAAAGERYCRRHGLCCSRVGCRRSTLLRSVRYPGRRVDLEVVVLLACLQALIGGMGDAAPIADVPVKTVRRWLWWWTAALLLRLIPVPLLLSRLLTCPP